MAVNWSDIAGVVGKAAPILGILLGGPAGGAIGALIASGLGVGNSPDEVQAALSNPDALVKLRQIEADRQVHLQELVVQAEQNRIAAETARIQADVDDRKSARSREVDAKDSMTPRILAAGVTLGFFGVLGFLLYNGKPVSGGDALLVMLGSLGTAWTAIIAYYFGSSSGSDRKTELLAAK